MTAQVKRAGSTRNAIRWGVLLAAVGTIGFRLPRLVYEFREWREVVSSGDSSAAEGWRISLLADSIGALVVLAVGMVVFYALRPRQTRSHDLPVGMDNVAGPARAERERVSRDRDGRA